MINFSNTRISSNYSESVCTVWWRPGGGQHVKWRTSAEIQPKRAAPRTATACTLSVGHAGPHMVGTSAAPSDLQFLGEEERYPHQCLLPPSAWHTQSTLDVCSHPYPAAIILGILCEKFIPDSALSSLTPIVSSKAAFKHVVELQISGITPRLLVPSFCAQLFARKVPRSSLGLSYI